MSELRGVLQPLVRSISDELVAVILEVPAEREFSKRSGRDRYIKKDPSLILILKP
jgi:hypothetical protein